MGANLFFKYIYFNIKAMSEFRLDFFISTISMVITNFFFMGTLVLLGFKYGGIGILSSSEILLAITIFNLSYAIGVNFFVGITLLQDYVINGTLDVLLIRPLSLYMHILIQKFNSFSLAEIITALIFLSFNSFDLWLKIIVFSILGGILMNINIYTMNLLPMFIDLNREVNLFESYITLSSCPPELLGRFLSKISFFVVPGSMIGFGAVYAMKFENWLFIYVAFFIISVLLFFILSKVGLKKYRSAGY